MRFFSQLILPAAALLLLTGCPKKEMIEEIKDKKWILETLNGEPANQGIKGQPGSKEVFIQFPSGEENRVEGHAGCNRFGGQYELEGQLLTFGPLMSTKMACPDLELENRFMKAMETVDSYDIGGEVLTLKSGGMAVAAFREANE